MVCSFQEGWARGRPWLRAAQNDKFKAWCSVCLKTFSIKEGQTAVSKHQRSAKHVETDAVKDQNGNNAVSGQSSIENSLKHAEALAVKARKVKDKALEAEAMLVTAASCHSIPEAIFDCFNLLLPAMFPDSEIAKVFSVGRTKAGYLLTEGIGPHYRQQVLECMKKHPFSLNFDESTVNKNQQLNINVSFRNDEDKIVKSNFVTVKVVEGSTGSDMAHMVLKSLDDESVPRFNFISEQTDGCAAMLGKFKGCHSVLKQSLPHLPDFGGCEAHDACNILKHGLKKMMPEMTTLYSCIWANLEKHSMKKNQEFKEVCSELGYEHRHTPKFFEVRFRYVVLLAGYMEDNDRPLYVYYKALAEEFKEGKELSETEVLILRIYLKDYILVRLVNKFLVSVGKSFVQFIDFFEAREVRVQYRFEKMLLLLTQHMSNFLINGGFSVDQHNPTAKDAIAVDFKKPGLLLSVENIFVGAKVKEFIKKLGLSPSSPELRDFYCRVAQFYTESTEFMIKYFTTGLTSKTLQYLSVLDPSAKNLDLDASRKRWLYLADKFPNVVSSDETEDLRLELVDYKTLEDPDEDTTVDDWFAHVASLQVVGEKRFPILSKLALSLATLYNSSSEAERDFHKQNLIHSDKKRHAMSQSKLQSNLSVMSHASQLSKDCQRCLAAKETRKKKVHEGEESKRVQIAHCHCSFLRPDQELLSTLRSGAPSLKYKESLRVNKMDAAERKDTDEDIRQTDKKDSDKDLLREVRLLKRRFLDESVKNLKVSKKAKLEASNASEDASGSKDDATLKNAAKEGEIDVAKGSERKGVDVALKGKFASGSGVKGRNDSGRKRAPVAPSKKALKRAEQVDKLLWLVKNK